MITLLGMALVIAFVVVTYAAFSGESWVVFVFPAIVVGLGLVGLVNFMGWW